MGRPEFLENAEATIRAVLPLMLRAPLASNQLLIALDSYPGKSSELVIVVQQEHEVAELVKQVREIMPANSTLVCRAGDQEYRSTLFDTLFSDKRTVDGQPTLYICSNFQCQAPVMGTDAIIQAVRQIDTQVEFTYWI